MSKQNSFNSICIASTTIIELVGCYIYLKVRFIIKYKFYMVKM